MVFTYPDILQTGKKVRLHNCQSWDKKKLLNYFVGVIDSLETVVAFTFTDYNNIIISEFM